LSTNNNSAIMQTSANNVNKNAVKPQEELLKLQETALSWLQME
jgi:hypothetical protein